MWSLVGQQDGALQEKVRTEGEAGGVREDAQTQLLCWAGEVVEASWLEWPPLKMGP